MIFFKIIIANKSSLLTQTYTRTYMAIVLINKWFKQFKVIDRKTMGTYNNEILKKKKKSLESYVPVNESGITNPFSLQ